MRPHWQAAEITRARSWLSQLELPHSHSRTSRHALPRAGNRLAGMQGCRVGRPDAKNASRAASTKRRPLTTCFTLLLFYSTSGTSVADVLRLAARDSNQFLHLGRPAPSIGHCPRSCLNPTANISHRFLHLWRPTKHAKRIP